MSARRAKPCPKRKLVLVDVENLVGCSPRAATPPMWAGALDALFRVVAITDDLVIIGVNPKLAFVCHEIAPRARIRLGKGPNGADRCLRKELEDVRFIQRRFTDVVVASGDGAFLEAVIALNEAGIHTTVVALEGQLSTALRLAAKTVLWLPSPRRLGEAA